MRALRRMPGELSGMGPSALLGGRARALACTAWFFSFCGWGPGGEQPRRDRGQPLRGRVIEGLFRSGDGDGGRLVCCRTARAGVGWLQPARAGVQLPALGNSRTWPYECAGKDRLRDGTPRPAGNLTAMPSLLDPPGYQLRVRPGIPPLPSWRRRHRSSSRSIIRARLVCPSWRFVPVARRLGPRPGTRGPAPGHVPPPADHRPCQGQQHDHHAGRLQVDTVGDRPGRP